MRNIAYIICGGILLLAATYFLAEDDLAHAQKEIPEEAKEIGMLIQRRAEEYRGKDAEAEPVRTEIRKLTEQLGLLEAELEKIAGGAEGLDYALCAQYGLAYVRATEAQAGSFVTVEDCSTFQ